MNTRSAYWDNLKLLLITLVVMGHFIDPLTSDSGLAKSIFMAIYSVHVPLFLFVSGVFYSEHNLRRKVLFFICMGFLLKFLNLFTEVFVLGQEPSFLLLSGKAAPWYLFVLAVYLLLRYLLRDINRRFLLCFSVVLACAAGYDRSLGDYLYLSRIVVFFPFYLAGSMVDRSRFANAVKKKTACYVGAIMVLLVFFYVCRYRLGSVYIYRHLLTGRNPYSEDVVSYGWIARLGCYAVSSLVGLSIMILVPSRRIPRVSDWGKNTLNVFFWHKFIYNILVRFTAVNAMFLGSIPGALAFLLIPVGLSILLSAVPWFSFPAETVRRICFSAVPERGSK